MILNRAAILAAKDLKTKPIPVPEWGEGAEVLIAEISAAQRDECGKAYVELKEASQLEQVTAFRNRMLAYALVGEDLKPIFTLEQVEAELLGKNGDVIDRLATEALKLNKMEPKAVEKEAKLSGADPSAGSSSA